MKKLICFILVVCSILLGCKKDIVEPIGWLGSWELVSVDTCYRYSPFFLYDYSELVPIEVESGRIDFFNDSTGYFDLSQKLVGQNNSFSWKYTNLSDTALAFFPIYKYPKIFTIDSLTEESLHFHYSSFSGQTAVGGPIPFYFLKTKRVKN